MSSMSNKSTPYEIKDVPGKGVGLFATRDISVGELIITEKPLFTASSLASVLAAFNGLDSEEKTRFMELRDTHYPDRPSPITIFKTNSLPLETGEGLVAAGIFLISSRINHSCLPNVHHSWNSVLREENIRAISFIRTGQEILMTYVGMQGSRAERQAHFRSRLGFECTCQFCTGAPNPASDIRRHRVQELDDKLAKTTLNNPVEGYKLAKERLRLLDAENLADQGEKGRTHYDAFQPCVYSSDFTTAKRHVGLAYAGCILSEGPEADNAIKFERYYRAPARHPAAGMGRKRKMPMICDTCGCVAKTVVCKGCNCAVYCDDECQKEHAKWHDPLCQIVQQKKWSV